MKRRKLSKSKSRKTFRKGLGTQSANLRSGPMRGGFRI